MWEPASSAHRGVYLSTDRSAIRHRHRRQVLLSIVVFVVVCLLAVATLELSTGGETGLALYSAVVTDLSPTTTLVVGVAVSGGHVSAAFRAVKSEKEQVEAEQEAFAEFAREVKTVSTAGRTARGTNAQTVNATSGKRELAGVRETYRETVMSTPGFDREYDESFREHVAAEFGDDTASLLTDGQHLNQPIKRLLAQQASQSARHRQLLLEGLTVEERSLEEGDSALEPIRETLADIDCADLSTVSLSELADLDAELRAQRAECRELLRTRQKQIHTVNRRVKGNSKTLTQEYLYRDLPVSFPVLTTILDCLDSIADARSSIVEAVCGVH